MTQSLSDTLPEEMREIVYVDLRIDYAFKLVFGTPGNEDLLLHLVQALLPDKQIDSVSLVSQEQVGLRPDARKTAVDVKCHTDHNETFIIEMQIKGQEDFRDRMIFYSSFPIINGLRKGDNTYQLTPLYMVAITDFLIPGIPPNEDLINHYTIQSIKYNGVEFSDSIHYLTVELPKLTKNLPEVKETVNWVFYTIKNIGHMREMPSEYKGSYLEKIFSLSKFAAMSEQDQSIILAEYKRLHDDLSWRYYTEKNATEKGLAEGREKGLAEGRAEGRAEGLMEVTRRMLAKGMYIAAISEITLLTKEEILRLSGQD